MRYRRVDALVDDMQRLARVAGLRYSVRADPAPHLVRGFCDLVRRGAQLDLDDLGGVWSHKLDRVPRASGRDGSGGQRVSGAVKVEGGAGLGGVEPLDERDVEGRAACPAPFKGHRR